MNGQEKSNSAIVAGKPTNGAGQPAEESVEPRAGAEEKVSHQSTRRAQYWRCVSQAMERLRQPHGAQVGVASRRHYIRGRSRMRETRTYGSVRGRAAMRVPTGYSDRFNPLHRPPTGTGAKMRCGVLRQPCAGGGPKRSPQGFSPEATTAGIARSIAPSSSPSFVSWRTPSSKVWPMVDTRMWRPRPLLMGSP